MQTVVHPLQPAMPGTAHSLASLHFGRPGAGPKVFIQASPIHYLPFEAFVTAALWYLAITFVLVALFRAAERRWLTPFIGHRG